MKRALSRILTGTPVLIYGEYGVVSDAGLLTMGSMSNEVCLLQSRLIALGYYHMTPDCLFGYQTYLAVVRFQKEHGLTPDGIVGPLTRKALGMM
ncbi:MAG TPA: hypothetical protein GXX40_04745 [Firmicutes bacterium]|nr:hypothetical protein [Bacillota bacterium]